MKHLFVPILIMTFCTGMFDLGLYVGAFYLKEKPKTSVYRRGDKISLHFDDSELVNFHKNCQVMFLDQEIVGDTEVAWIKLTGCDIQTINGFHDPAVETVDLKNIEKIK